jgi:hypothetical protein
MKGYLHGAHEDGINADLVAFFKRRAEMSVCLDTRISIQR